MPRRIRRFGWIPDLPDIRDHLYSAPQPTLEALPARVDLRPQCPPVLNQGRLGSCTANAIANAHLFDQRRQRAAKPFLPSRLFIYYNERVIEGTVNTDAGAQIRDGIKSVAKDGVCSEATWPYVIGKFTKKPSAAAYTEAKKYTATSYSRVTRTLTQMKGCLASGYPFVFGFTVYERFASKATAATGEAQLPLPGEGVVGGHAVLAVGYDDSRQRFLVMNSWGTRWGQGGCFTMPYAYLTDTDLAADFWTVRVVEV